MTLPAVGNHLPAIEKGNSMRKSCKPSAYAVDYAMALPYLQVLLHIS